MILKYLLALLLVVIVVVPSACSQTPNEPTPTPTLTPTLAPNEFDPSEMLINLSQTSTPFKNFYDVEIEPLNNTIRWFRDSELPRPAQTYITDYDCAANVSLLQKPPFKRDAFIIAHELAAVVICNNGIQKNWGLRCKDENIGNITVNGALFNMISIPLRDSILADYDFDVEDYYLSIVQDLPTFLCDEPMNTLKMHMCAWDYVWLTLYWQDVLSNHAKSTDPELDKVFRENQLDAYKEGCEILAKVNDIGYNTSNKVKILFQWIIDKYNLECNIK